MKFKLVQLDIVLLSLTFYEIQVLPHTLFLGFKYAVLLYLFARYCTTAKKIPFILIPVTLYGVVNVVSSIYNHMAQTTIVASAFFALQIIDIFLISEYTISRYSIEYYIKPIFGTFMVLALLTDSLMLVVKYNFSNPSQIYFIGNKFVVSYIHCFASALAFMLSYQTDKVISFKRGVLKVNSFSRRMFAYAILIFSLLICRKVTCSTGMIACAVLFVAMLMPNAARAMMANSNVVIIVIGAVNFLLLGTYSILNTNFVHEVIYGYFEKSTTWNGRLIIWENIFKLILKKPILGYGYYNIVIRDEVGFGNAQNAVLKFLLDVGVVGLVLYLILIWMSFRSVSGTTLKRIYPMVGFFYAMIFVSLVEINLTHMIVFITMAIIYSTAKKLDRSDRNENRNLVNAENP